MENNNDNYDNYELILVAIFLCLIITAIIRLFIKNDIFMSITCVLSFTIVLSIFLLNCNDKCKNTYLFNKVIKGIRFALYFLCFISITLIIFYKPLPCNLIDCLSIISLAFSISNDIIVSKLIDYLNHTTKYKSNHTKYY